MTGCQTCGGFGNRHDAIAHGATPDDQEWQTTTEPCCDYRDHSGDRAACSCECHGTRCVTMADHCETPFVLKLNGQEVTVAEVPDLPERGLTSLTYSYGTAIQVRSVDDLDGRVLLHEVLHALLRTDPQKVCPAADPRHEDFVRMLTAGLHDAAGYRLRHPLAEEAS